MSGGESDAFYTWKKHLETVQQKQSPMPLTLEKPKEEVKQQETTTFKEPRPDSE